MSFHIEYLMSKTEKPIVKVNGYYIHSKFDPEKEAIRIAEESFKLHHIHIIYGYGLGYVVDALLQKVADGKIIIVDPLIKEKKFSLAERHQKDERIIYWDDNDINTLAYVIHSNAGGLDLKVNIICGNNYDKLFTEHYHDTLRYIRDFQNKTQINQNTVTYFAKLWQENMIKNLVSIKEDESLAILHKRFDLPIVVCSGGPSLTKQLPLLKEIAEHVIIIAVGSTINSLVGNGVTPDFVVSIDGGEPNYNHFKDQIYEDTRLIYTTFNHYGIRKSFTKKAFVFAAKQQDVIVKYLYKYWGIDVPLMTGGGTVAHFSYTIAHLFESGPVTILGQDLAYTNNQTHADFNKHTKRVEDIKELGVDLIKVDGYDGEDVYTSRSFQSMLMTFEEITKLFKPAVPTFNSTEGGVKIKGLEQLPFKEFVEQYVDKTKYKDFSELDNEEHQPTNQINAQSNFKKELNRIAKLKKALQQGIQALEKNKSKSEFDQSTLKKLNKVDREVEKLAKEVSVYFLIEPITLEIETQFLEKANEKPFEAYTRVYNQSMTLYTKLLEAVKVSEEIINETLLTIREEE